MTAQRHVQQPLSWPQGGPDARVLFIGGSGRSGSTLLDLILGQVPGAWPVGELSYVWLRGLKENELCGCGRPFRECPFWKEVGIEAFGGWERLDPEATVGLRARVDRVRYMPWMMVPAASPNYKRRLDRYAELLRRLFVAIHKVSGASVIVDSTKHVSSASLLRQVPGLDLRIVHLVRDSRGVAYSWTKEMKKPEVVEGDAYLDTYAPARMGARWLGYNLLFHALRADPAIPSALVRYEDLIRSPVSTIERVVDVAGLDLRDQDVGWLREGWVPIEAEHTVAGNPMRFQHGRMELRLDEKWRERMTPADRYVVSAVTSPLLLRYGYLRRQG
jgi:Sulfotransferase family